MTETALGFPLTCTQLAVSALLVRIGDGEAIEPEVVDTVAALYRAIEQEQLAGIIDVVPAYATILIAFDPEVTDGGAVEAAVRGLADRGVARQVDTPRTVIIPTAYGGQHGPDLEEVAKSLALTPTRLIELHSGAEYQVAFMGFSPGWAYLMGTPAELAIPRRAEPRTRVPAGSVSLGGGQTGIYPSESPGGWHLIGRTPLRMFDPERSDPFMLHPGDRVRFAPIDEKRFEPIRQSLAGADD
jgi:KipI family sensor histidine kinase inhibitor